MHQTTIRFSPEVWARLEEAALDGGVSAAHYVREAVVARLAYAAAQRTPAPDLAEPHPRPADGFRVDEPRSAAARAASLGALAGAEAVWAQARLARARAQEVREASRSVQSAVRTERRTSAWRRPSRSPN